LPNGGASKRCCNIFIVRMPKHIKIY
jgi:hypothetical protein